MFFAALFLAAITSPVLFFLLTVLMVSVPYLYIIWKQWQKRKRAERALSIRIATDQLPGILGKNSLIQGHDEFYHHAKVVALLERNSGLLRDIGIDPAPIRRLDRQQVSDIAMTLAASWNQNLGPALLEDWVDAEMMDVLAGDRDMAKDIASDLQRALARIASPARSIRVSPGEVDQAARVTVKLLHWVERTRILNDQQRQSCRLVLEIIATFLRAQPVFSVDKDLGQGGQGKIVLVTHGERQYAMKIFSPENAYIKELHTFLDNVHRRFLKEKLVQRLQHENIVKMHHFFGRVIVATRNTAADHGKSSESQVKLLDLPAYTMDVYSETLSAYIKRKKTAGQYSIYHAGSEG